MSFKVNKGLVLLSLVMLLSACGGGSSSGRGSGAAFDGVWKNSPACESEVNIDPVTNEVDKSSMEASATIMGSTLTLNVTEYSATDDCTGNHDDFVTESTLTYGKDVPNAAPAASICSNTKEVDVAIKSAKVNGVALTDKQLAAAIASDDIPGLDHYGLICSSPDGFKLYFGDDEGGTKLGKTKQTRPTLIDASNFLVK